MRKEKVYAVCPGCHYQLAFPKNWYVLGKCPSCNKEMTEGDWLETNEIQGLSY